MKLQINGQTKDFSDIKNLAGIVSQFSKDSKTIIAEVNGAIVPSIQWDKTPVKDGDAIELVTFVGGG